LLAEVLELDKVRRMVRDITIYGDPVLREKCRPVEEVDDALRALAEDMIETMVDAEGVGLAASQVGVPVRLAVVDVSHDPECVTVLRVDGREVAMEDVMPLVFINPELELEGPEDLASEGCLSIPEVRANVKRPWNVRARLTLLDGRVIELETDGLLARALQHEVDHLNGILFIDRVSPAAKVRLRNPLRRLQESRKRR